MIMSIRATAKLVGNHYGVPWEILAGIAVHESDGGRALSAPHNYVGVKWMPTNWKLPGKAVSTREFKDGRPVTVRAQFVSFYSLEHCLGYLAEILCFSHHYRTFRARLEKGKPLPLLLEAIQQGGYATDPAWANKVMARIQRDVLPPS